MLKDRNYIFFIRRLFLSLFALPVPRLAQRAHWSQVQEGVSGPKAKVLGLLCALHPPAPVLNPVALHCRPAAPRQDRQDQEAWQLGLATDQAHVQRTTTRQTAAVHQ